MTEVTMRQLLEVGVHFGHQTRFWCPKMGPYIYGHRNKIHIINLEQTVSMFNDAMNYLGAVAAKRGSIMFVGTKSQASTIIQEQAKRASSPYVYHRWLGGMLTNYSTVRQSIDRLNALEETINSEGYSKMSKKEGLRIEREHFRLHRNLVGIRDMKGLPEALFVIDVKHEYIAIQEANKLGIPVVAVVDTNCDPDGIDYVIPGNDDSISAIRLYCSSAADAILAGYATASSQPFIFDAHADEGDQSVVNTVVTPAKAAVAPDDDLTEEVRTEVDAGSVEAVSEGDAAQTPAEPAEAEPVAEEPAAAAASEAEEEPVAAAEPAAEETADDDGSDQDADPDSSAAATEADAAKDEETEDS